MASAAFPLHPDTSLGISSSLSSPPRVWMLQLLQTFQPSPTKLALLLVIGTLIPPDVKCSHHVNFWFYFSLITSLSELQDLLAFGQNLQKGRGWGAVMLADEGGSCHSSSYSLQVDSKSRNFDLFYLIKVRKWL